MPYIGLSGASPAKAFGWGSYQVTGDLGAMVSLQSITIGSNGPSTITFRNIPQTYSNLYIHGFVRSSRSATTDQLFLRFNNDSTTAYSLHRFSGSGNGSNAVSGSDPNRTEIEFYPLASDVNASGIFGVFELDILDYTNTTTYKTARVMGGYDANGSGSAFQFSGNWRNTNAINRVDILWQTAGSIFKPYSEISLYGVKAAS